MDQSKPANLRKEILSAGGLDLQSHPSGWGMGTSTINSRPSIYPKPNCLANLRPSPSTITCNSDGAWNSTTRDAGLGWIFSDPVGEIGRGGSHNNTFRQPVWRRCLRSEMLCSMVLPSVSHQSGSVQMLKRSSQRSPRTKDRQNSTASCQTLLRYPLLLFSASFLSILYLLMGLRIL